MVAAGELDASGDGYRLVGRLLDRQARQAASRAAATVRWDGTWELAVVRSGAARSAADRAALRQALTDLRLGELREGTWMRPANLAPDRTPTAQPVAAAQCLRVAHAVVEPDPGVIELWDLAAWAADAQVLRTEMTALLPRLEADDPTALREGFETSAAVLRLFGTRSPLPRELVPEGWPGTDLRGGLRPLRRRVARVVPSPPRRRPLTPALTGVRSIGAAARG